MPSTHLSLHYHIVFSTKDRRFYIKDEWKSRLFRFLAGCVREAGGKPLAVGGVSDHVHLLIGMKSTQTVAGLVKDVKTASTRWVHSQIELRVFCWQTGYAAFTVSPSAVDSVRKYIERQEIQHSRKGFKKEYLELLEQGKVEFDERFLW